MRFQKKIITSENKKSGYYAQGIFSTQNIVLIYCRFKGDESNKTKLLFFNPSLEIIKTSIDFYNIDGIIGSFVNNNDYVYFHQNGLFLINKNEEKNVFEFPHTDVFVSNTLINIDKILTQEPNNENFRCFLVDIYTTHKLWEKTLSHRTNFFLKVEYKKLMVYVDHILDKRRIECFNLETGDLVWSNEVQDWFVYNGPFDIVYKNQVRQLVIYKHLVIANMQGHIVAIDIESGKEEWRTDIGLVNPTILYFFILDEQDGQLWFITGVSGANKGRLKCLDALTGAITFEAKELWAETGPPFPNKAYDRWFPHFSMNKNFIFLTFDGDAIAVMSKKTGEIVEWLSISKRNGVTQMGHKLLNRTLYQATEFELLAIDVSEYFIDGDEYEKNAKDD